MKTLTCFFSGAASIKIFFYFFLIFIAYGVVGSKIQSFPFLFPGDKRWVGDLAVHLETEPSYLGMSSLRLLVLFVACCSLTEQISFLKKQIYLFFNKLVVSLLLLDTELNQRIQII